MSRKRYNLKPEEFVTAWQTSASVQEVADKFGMPRDIVSARASSYRKVGVKLKKMRDSRSDLKGVDFDTTRSLASG